MDQTVLLWILGIQTTVIIGLAVGLFQHVKECRDVRTEIAEIKAIAQHVRAELGNHETGIRGQLHEHRKHLVKLAGKVPGGLEVFD
jgi:hypothetical protein